jgi:hypothetical protein
MLSGTVLRSRASALFFPAMSELRIVFRQAVYLDTSSLKVYTSVDSVELVGAALTWSRTRRTVCCDAMRLEALEAVLAFRVDGRSRS